VIRSPSKHLVKLRVYLPKSVGEEYPMAPRANWKGYLRLSLVSCPIALYPASSLVKRTVSIGSTGKLATD
jgi:hypothetical protein